MEYPAIISNGQYLIPTKYDSTSNKHHRLLAQKHPDGVYLLNSDDYSTLQKMPSVTVVFNLKSKHLRGSSLNFARSLGFESDGGVEELAKDLRTVSDKKIDTLAIKVDAHNVSKINLEIFKNEFHGVETFRNIDEWLEENPTGTYAFVDKYLSDDKIDSDARNALFKSEIDGYLINHDLQNVLFRLHSTWLGLNVQFFILLGSSGSGKTDFAKKIIPQYLDQFEYDYDYLFLDPTSFDEAEKVFASKEIVTINGNMETHYITTKTTDLLLENTSTPLVLAINEFNRGGDEDYINALVPLTEETPRLSYGGETYWIARPLIIIATGNTGIEFSSASRIDAALLNRASIVNMTLPDRNLWNKAALEYVDKIKDQVIVDENFYTNNENTWENYNNFARKLSSTLFEMSNEARKQDCGINVSFRQMKRILFNVLVMTYLYGAFPSIEEVTTQVALDTTYTLDIEQTDVLGALNAIMEKGLI